MGMASGAGARGGAETVKPLVRMRSAQARIGRRTSAGRKRGAASADLAHANISAMAARLAAARRLAQLNRGARLARRSRNGGLLLNYGGAVMKYSDWHRWRRAGQLWAEPLSAKIIWLAVVLLNIFLLMARRRPGAGPASHHQWYRRWLAGCRGRRCMRWRAA